MRFPRPTANDSLPQSDALLRHTKGWNQRAQVMSRELDSQNEQIDRTRGKTENLETEMDYLDAKMKRQLKRN
jgi:peptidoglycan hydrolase CwlO-like protein